MQPHVYGRNTCFACDLETVCTGLLSASKVKLRYLNR